MHLAGLADSELRTMMSHQLEVEVAALPRELVQLVSQRSEGNPLHALEMVKLLRERGAIEVLTAKEAQTRGYLPYLGSPADLGSARLSAQESPAAVQHLAKATTTESHTPAPAKKAHRRTFSAPMFTAIELAEPGCPVRQPTSLMVKPVEAAVVSTCMHSLMVKPVEDAAASAAASPISHRCLHASAHYGAASPPSPGALSSRGSAHYGACLSSSTSSAPCVRYALGSEVYVTRSNGEESTAFVMEYDAAKKLYTVELEQAGSGKFKQCREDGMREGPGALSLRTSASSSASSTPASPVTTPPPPTTTPPPPTTTPSAGSERRRRPRSLSSSDAPDEQPLPTTAPTHYVLLNSEKFDQGMKAPKELIPDSLKAIVTERIDNLSPALQLLLKTCSVVCNGDFELHMVIAIHPTTLLRAEAVRLLDHLVELEIISADAQAGLAPMTAPANGAELLLRTTSMKRTYRFASTLVQEVR